MKRKFFSRLLSLLLVAALIVAFGGTICGCGNDITDTTTDATESTVLETEQSVEKTIPEYMDELVQNYPREEWDEALAEMPWPCPGINTFNLTDPAMYGAEAWTYYHGEFSLTDDAIHHLEWSYNIVWDVDPDDMEQTRTFELENPNESGYMLLLRGDTYFYMVEISTTLETNITTLENYTIDGFYNLWSALEVAEAKMMVSFLESPVIDDELLNKLYGFEQDYDRLWEYVNQISDEDGRETAIHLMKTGSCSDPIVTYLYDSEYRDFTFAIREDGMWDLRYSYMYQDGTYTLAEHNLVIVKWSQNIRTDSQLDDFKDARSYEVINPNEDAYLLLYGDETGYTLVRIVGVGNKDVKTEDTHPVYTEDEFSSLYNSVFYKCEEGLAEMAETHELTPELLEYLLINDQDIDEVHWYGERLTGTELEHYHIRKDGGSLNSKIDVINLDSTTFGHNYSYKNGVFTMESKNVEIVCTENIDDIKWDPYEEGYRNLSIDELDQSGFVLTLGEGGYHLYYFTTG